LVLMVYRVYTLGYTVNDIHNCIIAMGFRQFDYEVNTDYIPWCLKGGAHQRVVDIVVLSRCTGHRS
jgi:hypothetical protein